MEHGKAMFVAFKKRERNDSTIQRIKGDEETERKRKRGNNQLRKTYSKHTKRYGKGIKVVRKNKNSREDIV
jgi:hypothetical protein